MAATRAIPQSGAPTVSAVRRVALVGLPGSGKSAVGAALARRLGWRHVDTDALVEQRAGRSVSEIFAVDGEPGFRERELQALRDAFDGDAPLVLSCGGGLAAQPHAGQVLFDGAWVVWLDAADTVLLRRLGGAADRPLLRDDPAAALNRLRADRAASYGRAHLRVDVDDWDVEGVVDAVVDALSGARLAPRPVVGDPGTGGSAAAHIPVALGARSYTVSVVRGSDAAAAAVLAALPDGARRVALVADSVSIAGDQPVVRMARAVERSIAVRGVETTLIRLRGGEQLKTWAAAGRLVNRLAALGLDRGDCVVAAGGGTVGDLAGFAAASYQRGIAVIHLPTTLLAMVDSAVGGKTGVDLPAGKNLAGAFWQPRAVVCDVDALATVPERDWRAAFAEIVKYPMIAAADLRAALDSHLDALLARDRDALVPVIARCCAIKAEVVSDDEREAGRRAILNYGHTVGHALETVTGHDMVHGEAVAAGMRVAGLLSVSLRDCPRDDVAWQDDTLSRCGLGALSDGLDPQRIVDATRSDKKSRAGAVRWVLLDQLGSAGFGHLVPEDAVAEAIARVQHA
ncbi:MAG TPA: 3-dehydroquinate synthase [Candidatus Dormibacteraeota bacterium]|jgi:3-dehydroquinate synthase|nr:3-dehydroquinate synthase [Candidatus Dormibacteraeota bacterium]